MSLAAGSILGTYEILAPLGKGGMGEVWRARDTRLGREIAIKVLPADVAANGDRLARFEREARAVAALNHPNIVVLHSVEDEDEVRFLTMELVEGQGLDQLVAPGGLPVGRVLEIGIALADALTAAHARGVVHRDLKPANVMITREGRIKVLDFGLAKLAEESGADDGATQAATRVSPLSGVGQVVGTIAYMSPEQLRGEAVDARTDLFALGILLYELAAGRRPFGGASAVDTGSAILRDVPEPLARVRDDLPADLARLVARCLEKDPAARFPSALEACNELRRIRHELETSGRPTGAAPAAREAVSVAVLPFVNRSRDAEDEYFSDGLADELLNVLAKIRGLHVAARTSSFQFKGTTESLAVIGQRLNVTTLVEGSVRKSGNRVRISVQLVNVADGYHLWSETYDRTLDDIFAVQDDIAQSVVKELRKALLGEEHDSRASGEARAEVAAAARGRRRDPEAHRLYLQGRYFADRATPEDFTKARVHLERALEIDPGFALAWTAMAYVHFGETALGLVRTEEGFPRCIEAAERAYRLEPDLPETLEALAMCRISIEHEWREARRLLDRAVELAPDSAMVRNRYCAVAGTLGRLDEAIDHGRRACELDPLGVRNYLNLGFAYHMAKRWDEAETAFRKALELNPARTVTHSSLALLLLERGRLDEALAEAEAEPDPIFGTQARALVLQAMGRRDESDAALAKIVENWSSQSPFQIAEIHAMRGDADRAFEWIERAFEEKDSGLGQIRFSPCFRELESDPRYAGVLQRSGLAD